MKNSIYEHFELINDGVYIPSNKTFIISDIHIGLGLKYNKLNYNIKIDEPKRIISKIKSTEKKIETLVILGDIKHSFSFDLKEDIEISNLIKSLKKDINSIIYIKGNHDKNLKISNLKLKENLIINLGGKKIFLSHGDRPDALDHDFIIIGHEHPKITLTDEKTSRTESYKVYIKNEKFLILPAFNDFSQGNNVLDNNFMTKTLSHKEILNSSVVESKTKENLGKIKDLIKILSKNKW